MKDIKRNPQKNDLSEQRFKQLETQGIWSLSVLIFPSELLPFYNSMHLYKVDVQTFFYFIWSKLYFRKYSFLKFRGFLIIKTTFSYFPGVFENPAPAIKTSVKQDINEKTTKK